MHGSSDSDFCGVFFLLRRFGSFVGLNERILSAFVVGYIDNDDKTESKRQDQKKTREKKARIIVSKRS